MPAKKPTPRKKKIGTRLGSGMLRVSVTEYGQMKSPRPKTISPGGFKKIGTQMEWVEPIVEDRRKRDGKIRDRKKEKK
ncbi:MAG: hypothetical protein ABIA76_04555 [Candidatus Diapherotrites archaeon]